MNRAALAIICAFAFSLAWASEDVVVRLLPGSHGFRIVDSPSRDQGIRQVIGQDTAYAITGGYFSAEFDPVGFYRIEGRTLQSGHHPRLSGYLCVDAQGRLTISREQGKAEAAHSALQAGPLLIDPGGSIGIRTDNGDEHQRCAVAVAHDGSIILLYRPKSTLLELAQWIKEQVPDVEVAINLDGGPSAAFFDRGAGDLVESRGPVRSFVLATPVAVEAALTKQVEEPDAAAGDAADPRFTPLYAAPSVRALQDRQGGRIAAMVDGDEDGATIFAVGSSSEDFFHRALTMKVDAQGRVYRLDVDVNLEEVWVLEIESDAPVEGAESEGK